MRLTPTKRKKEILDAGMVVAVSKGFHKVTLQDVARQAGCVHSLILHHYGTSNQLRRAIMSEAIRVRNVSILAQGLALGDSKARRASPELKALAAEYLMGEGA